MQGHPTVVVPLARVDTMPPSVASAPGSTGKKRPASRRCSLSCFRVTPALRTIKGRRPRVGENETLKGRGRGENQRTFTRGPF
eukprot:365718-Chlamydomonas_euryale.AAC.19